MYLYRGCVPTARHCMRLHQPQGRTDQGVNVPDGMWAVVYREGMNVAEDTVSKTSIYVGEHTIQTLVLKDRYRGGERWGIQSRSFKEVGPRVSTSLSTSLQVSFLNHYRISVGGSLNITQLEWVGPLNMRQLVWVGPFKYETVWIGPHKYEIYINQYF